MTLVVDASVVLKWLFQDSERESGTARATQLMAAIARNEVGILQPVHWLAEVASVLARETPARAVQDALMLEAMRLPIAEGPEILRRACELSAQTGQHLFDTLYHAVALETPDAELITADERYASRAGRFGCLRLLRDWPSAGGPDNTRGK